MNVQQRIRRDARLVADDPAAAALLECLAKHIFDPDLDTRFLARVCGATRDVRNRLTAKIRPLKAYVTELRMIEAGRLVRDTDMPIPEIARKVGFRVERSFRRTFKRCHGASASKIRQQLAAERAQQTPVDPVAAAQSAVDQLETAAGEAAPGEAAPGAPAARLRRRAAAALLDERRAAELRLELRRRHPQLEPGAYHASLHGTAEGETEEDEAPPQLPTLLMPTGDYLETFTAGAVFEKILELPDEALPHALLQGVRMGSAAAFEVFHQACYQLVPFDPERAVFMAELGVRLIDEHRDVMKTQGDDWKALTWAVLGRVQMLVGDFSATEQALAFAWQEVEDGAGGTVAPWAEIEIRRVEAMLEMRRGHDDQAARALDRAVELARGLEPGEPKRIHTVFERLEVASFAGDAEAAFRLCDELEELAEGLAAGSGDAGLWPTFASYHRAKAHAAAGDDRRAEKSLWQAGEHLRAVTGLDGTPEGFQASVLATFILHELARIAYREGRLDDYESLLRSAVERYRRIRVPMFEAAAEAELAVLCALRGKVAETRRLATSAARFLGALPLHRDALNASRRLYSLANGGAEAPKSELEELLAELRRDLDRTRWEITGTQATPASQVKRMRA